MALQELADWALGNSDEEAVEDLQDIGEPRAVALICWHEKVRRFVENEEAVKAAILDEDAVAGDIGEAANLRVVEAGDEFKTRGRPVEGAKNPGNQCPGSVDAEDAMSLGKTREESVLPPAQGVSIILLAAASRQGGEAGVAEDQFRRTPSRHVQPSERGRRTS